MSADRPQLGDLLLELGDMVKGTMYSTLPATVVSQDSSTLLVTVRPAVRVRVKDPISDNLTAVRLPDVANVPVAYPSATGFAITWPLSPGDDVLLVMADRSLDEWKDGDTLPTTPVDPRRFDLTDAVAVPMARPSSPIPASGRAAGALVIEGDDIRIGSSAAADFVALSSLVEAGFSSLKSWLDLHTHTGVTTGTGTSTGPSAPSPSAPSVGAAKVKAE